MHILVETIEKKAWVNAILSWQHCFNNGQLKEENSLPKSIKMASKYVMKDSCVPVWNRVHEEMEKKKDMHLKKPLKFILLNGTMRRYIRIYRTIQ